MPNAADSQHRDVLSDRPSGPWVIEAHSGADDADGIVDVSPAIPVGRFGEGCRSRMVCSGCPCPWASAEVTFVNDLNPAEVADAAFVAERSSCTVMRDRRGLRISTALT
jgi:hypothetical protein